MQGAVNGDFEAKIKEINDYLSFLDHVRIERDIKDLKLKMQRIGERHESILLSKNGSRRGSSHATKHDITSSKQ